MAPPIETCTLTLRGVRFADACTLRLPPNASVRAEDPGGAACCEIETPTVDMKNSCCLGLRSKRREVRGYRVIRRVECEIQTWQVLGRGAQGTRVDGAQLRQVQRFHQQQAQ